MIKAILLSVKPEHAVKILNGEQTLVLQKRVPKDFIGWVYLYVTKTRKKLILHAFDNVWRVGNCISSNENKPVNGKVVARFWFDEYTRLLPNFPSPNDYYDYFDSKLKLTREIIWRRLGLNKYDLSNYGKGKMIYAWHIKKLEIFNEPMELSEIYKLVDFRLTNSRASFIASMIEPLTKAPKGWRYVWVEK